MNLIKAIDRWQESLDSANEALADYVRSLDEFIEWSEEFQEKCKEER